MRISRLPRLQTEAITEFIGLSSHDHGIKPAQVIQVFVHSATTFHKTGNVSIRSGYKTVNGSGYIINNPSHNRKITDGVPDRSLSPAHQFPDH